MTTPVEALAPRRDRACEGEAHALPSVRLALVIHNHQPVGNFDGVFEAAARDAYEPFLDWLLAHPRFRATLHYSGSLLEWLEARRPSVVDKIAAVAARGQAEILGGGFYDPILPLLPDRDARDQVRSFREHLERRFRVPVPGAWIAERVWEASLVRALADAGVRYAVVDDIHFRMAGLTEAELDGGYVTEDRGAVLRVFPGLEGLRYSIPYDPPAEAAAKVRAFGTPAGDRLLVYADDGEKFGVWPGTKRRVYGEGWLDAFAKALEAAPGAIRLVTLSEAAAAPPRGRIYLPDASYREMMEWALPPARARELGAFVDRLKAEGSYERFSPFVRGGFYRNFRVRYPEAGWMYGRMIGISARLPDARAGRGRQRLRRARTALHRAQCNCAWWHGVFGGLYLPHLRDAVWRNLLAAEEGVPASRRASPVEVADVDLDGEPEIRLESRRFRLFLKPSQGGHLVEWDLRDARFNVLATMARRPEAYHAKIAAAPVRGGEDEVRTIHGTLAAKEQGLERLLRYDDLPRASLVDHLLPPGTTREALRDGEAHGAEAFRAGRFAFATRVRGGLREARLAAAADVFGGRLRLEKVVALRKGRDAFAVEYSLANDGSSPLRGILAVELHFSLLAGRDAGSRRIEVAGRTLGDLCHEADLPGDEAVHLVDAWQGLDFRVAAAGAAGVWTFPVETVSQSEAGYEAIYQSTAVVPRWTLDLPAGGTVRFSIECGCAPRR